VKDDKDGYKTFAYQSAALASAVTAAREIVKLKTENAELKQRLDAIEARLQALENN
jgi:cell division protein FtsB